MIRFQFFIGIDQTGAAAAGGREAKPLPCAILSKRPNAERWSLEVLDSASRPLKIKSLNRACIQSLVSERGTSLSRTALAVDAVMGLPEAAWPGCRGGSEALWNLFAQAARDEDGRAGFGLKPAAAFFDSLLEKVHLTGKPLRRCDVLAKANSVFSPHPFQKNVQCGTYRIWRDLGFEKCAPHERWLRLWNFDLVVAPDDLAFEQAWFFESYPSLFWRDILGAKSREIGELRGRVERVFADEVEIPEAAWDLLEADADHADSAVLALGAYFLQKNQNLLRSPDLPFEKWLSREGWILGLPHRPGS